MKKYQIKDLGKTQLWRLRQDIVLNSLFIKDYENRYNINAQEVCDFFEGYVDYLSELAHNKDDLHEILKYDNKQNLFNWFCCIEWGK